MGRRLQQSDFCFSEQHPWILPSSHRLSEMLIKHSHDEVMHSGMRDSLVQLRHKYWKPQIQMVKGVIAACTTCKRFKVRAMQQVTAPLPRDGITESPPFETATVDFASPLNVKSCWVILVRSVKTCLRKVMGRASLSFEELPSLLAEVEAAINSRPVTFVYNEPEEPQPLMPAHFLIGKRLSSLPPKPFHDAKQTFNSS